MATNPAIKTKPEVAQDRRRNPVIRGGFQKNTIAMVYDFDGTLASGSMQDHGLLPKLGIKPNEFWEKVRAFKAENESAMILTYMHLLLSQMREHEIDESQLKEFGGTIKLFPGVETWFDEIDQYVKEKSNGKISVKHYFVSAGLEEILAGNIVSKKAQKVFTSSYFWEQGVPTGVARAITDASKPQYIFRVVKGLEDYALEINEHMDEKDRPIPFSRVIFMGDGDTDVPSMTVTTQNGGHAIAVYEQDNLPQMKKCMQFYSDKRVKFYAKADFRKDKMLWKITTAVLQKIIADIRIEWADHLFNSRPHNRNKK